MATQNKEQARQVLLLHPNLTKAIFQAQFMLGMVTPQMLQMPNILQPAGLPLHPLFPDTRSQQQPQVVPGLPPLPPNTQFTLAKAHDTGGPSLTIPSSSSVQSQNGTLLQFSAYNQAQPLHAQSQILQHGHLPVQSGISTLPSLHHQLPSTLVSRPNPLEGPSSSLNQQIPVPLPQNMGPTISGLKPQITTIVAHPSLADQSLQVSHILQASGAAKGKQPSDNSHLVARPSKLLRLNDGRAAAADVNMNMIAGASGKPANNGIVGNLIPKTEAAYDSQKTGGQLQLPPDVESALLQQVMSLTPEQISSLPPDQQQQVIQLQQVLRQST
ncbi:hypothetical protein LIER_25226 [Lithospermum erythrorhizon]|uniref:Cleavage stimulating factor 64 n=1 Tax=Lithospermum erythrorhizon TaxID=34254 RepID=A0AAV3R444_LITER